MAPQTAGLSPPSLTDIAHFVWQSRYRQRTKRGAWESGVEQTWQRVASACAAIEGEQAPHWTRAYRKALADFRFLPGGRILAGAGTGQRVTLFNCFVMGLIKDSLPGICDALKESALTLQQGGGVGCDFSTLRPRGSQLKSTGRIASGSVSFLQLWDAMCQTLVSTSARGGAMMATLRCDHPDIEEFVNAKRTAGALSCFNLSVQVSDAFMAAVRNDESWPLVFPDKALVGVGGEILMRSWPGYAGETPCRVVQRLPARQLWEALLRAAWRSGEPGVMFVDTINRCNNLAYRENITTTNPCAEVPLPPYGACNLGSINLTRFVRAPFTRQAHLDVEGLCEITRTAVRLLDAVIDISRYPLPAQAEQARGTRRIGLGITGLADTLIMLRLPYDSDAARAQARRLMRAICHSSYEASIALAREKRAFPFFEREAYLASDFVQRLPAAIRDGIVRDGIRNSHLLAIAPTGGISLLANNVSTGIEPLYDLRYRVQVRGVDAKLHPFELESEALRCWRALNGAAPLPGCFVTASELAPRAHIAMQAALQPSVDNAISKTINLPADYPFDSFRQIYQMAYEQGLKGCTVYRPHAGQKPPLEASARRACGGYCEGPDRESRRL